MILHIPHSSRKIPAEVRNQFLPTDFELELELLMMTDAYTGELFGADLFPEDMTVVFPVSRLVVDPERFSNDNAEPMAKGGMGVVYTATHDGRPLRRTLAPHERQALLNVYYFPHHQRLSEAVDRELVTTGAALLLDCHSFASGALPYELDQSPERPQICVGTDDFHTPSDVAELLIQHFKSDGLTVEQNRPFSGSIAPMTHYRQDPRVVSVMIEVNRSLYMNEKSGAKTDQFKDTQDLIAKAVHCLKKYHNESRTRIVGRQPCI
jgi:N-formylglutamate deformylase